MSFHPSLIRAIDSASRALRTDPPLSLSEWADEFMYLSAESSSEPGKWESFGYQIGIMDAMSDDEIPKVTMMKSSRTGYTKMICSYVGRSIHTAKRSMLIVQPTDDDAKGFSKDEIAPMLRDVPVLNGLVSDVKKSTSSNTMLKKQAPGVTLNIVGAHTPRSFRRITVDTVVFDECDGYIIGAGAEGDQLKLGEKRALSSPHSKFIYGSTPTIKGQSRIEGLFEKSDQRFFMVPCPHCKKTQRLIWGEFRSSKKDDSKPKQKKATHGISWDRDAQGNHLPLTAHYICKHCHGKIEESSKSWMTDNGEWVATKPFNGHAGFHVSTLYSSFPNASWSNLVQEFLDSKGDPLTLQVFVNTVLGECWDDDQGEKLDWETIQNKAEPYIAQVPDEVVYLTVGADIQADRFEWEVVGWGLGEESWGIEYGVLHGDITQLKDRKKFAAELKKAFHKKDGTEIRVSIAAIDSGYKPDSVYDFSKENGLKWAIPIKGASIAGKPIESFPQKKSDKKVYLTSLGTDTIKDIIFPRLRMFESGPGFCHFPIDESTGYDEVFYKMLTAEKKVPTYPGGKRVDKYVCKPGVRNEATDCRVYSYAALKIAMRIFRVRLESLAKSANRGDNEAGATMTDNMKSLLGG